VTDRDAIARAYRERMRADARLVMLQALAGERNKTLGVDYLILALETRAIARGVDWVRAELRALEEMGAVKVREIAGELHGTISLRGEEHLASRIVLDGVSQPDMDT